MENHTEKISSAKRDIKWEQNQLKERSRYRKAAMLINEWSEVEEEIYFDQQMRSEACISVNESRIKVCKALGGRDLEEERRKADARKRQEKANEARRQAEAITFGRKFRPMKLRIEQQAKESKEYRSYRTRLIGKWAMAYILGVAVLCGVSYLLPFTLGEKALVTFAFAFMCLGIPFLCVAFSLEGWVAKKARPKLAKAWDECNETVVAKV